MYWWWILGTLADNMGSRLVVMGAGESCPRKLAHQPTLSGYTGWNVDMSKEPRAQFPKLRHHYYRIACAWCQRRIGRKRKDVSVPGDTTYGICQPCFADMVTMVSKMKA